MAKTNPLITEISESDFRKLGLKLRKGGAFGREVTYEDANDLIDAEIEACLNSGYPSDIDRLKTPLTIAVAKDGEIWWDKFMNSFSPASGYYFAVGIKHLYSTRDYYEDHEDYWRVKKDETEVIYRIHLDPKWAESFVLKHKTERQPWPYGDNKKGDTFLDIHYGLDTKTGEWKERFREKVKFNEKSTFYTPVDENGNEKRPTLAEEEK